MTSLPKPERDRALQTFGVWCQMELTGTEPPKAVLELLNFDSIEAVRTQLSNWRVPDRVTPEESSAKGPSAPNSRRPHALLRSGRSGVSLYGSCIMRSELGGSREGEKGNSMTDRRDEERERIEREEDDERRREEKAWRAEQLREAWRRHHPSDSEKDKDDRPKNEPPA